MPVLLTWGSLVPCGLSQAEGMEGNGFGSWIGLDSGLSSVVCSLGELRPF